MKTGSEKSWSSIQSYIKQKQGGNEEEEEEVEGGREERRARDDTDHAPRETDDQTAEPMRQDIDDLLGLEQEEPVAHHWAEEHPQVREKSRKHKKKSKKAKERNEGPPLISFDDDPIPAAQPSVDMTEDTPPSHKPRNKTKGTGYGAMAYGSSGDNATTTTSSKADDWSGDWGEDWAGGAETSKTKTDKSDGWDDWNEGEGWSSVDLKSS